MADEAVCVLEESLPIAFTVADGTGIEKGAILKMTDNMTAIINSGTNDTVAGIAAQEKIASDGKTKLAVYQDGIFRVYASGNITTGDPVGTIASYVNYVASQANTDLSGLKTLGYALEDATNGTQFLIKLKPSVAN